MAHFVRNGQVGTISGVNTYGEMTKTTFPRIHQSFYNPCVFHDNDTASAAKEFCPRSAVKISNAVSGIVPYKEIYLQMKLLLHCNLRVNAYDIRKAYVTGVSAEKTLSFILKASSYQPIYRFKPTIYFLRQFTIRHNLEILQLGLWLSIYIFAFIVSCLFCISIKFTSV